MTTAAIWALGTSMWDPAPGWDRLLDPAPRTFVLLSI